MVLPKKQMLIAIGAITLLIILSVVWIVLSQQSDGSNNGIIDNTGIQGDQNTQVDKLPLIKIILLTKSDCEECISLNYLVDGIKQAFDVNVLEVKEVEADSDEGKNLIAMHNITKLPSLIVNGEFEGTDLREAWSAVGDESNGVLILRTIEPPYFSLEENRLVGKVKYFLIKDSSCEDCEDLTPFFDYIKDLNVLIEEEKTLEYDSAEAQELIDHYFISKIPVVILTGDLEEYEYFSVLWVQGGGYTEDNAYIYEEAAPFFDLYLNEVKGLVEITRLIDENCSDCIDSNFLADPLTQQIKMKVIKDTTYSIYSPEGKALIEKYSITKIPTIIVSSEAEYYGEFTYAWQSVGTQEENKSFVFRNLELLEGNYTDLNQSVSE